MSEIVTTAPAITVEDLKQKAMHIRDLAETETRSVLERDAAKVALIGAVAIVAALSLAYYLGTRRARELPYDLL